MTIKFNQLPNVPVKRNLIREKIKLMNNRNKSNQNLLPRKSLNLNPTLKRKVKIKRKEKMLLTSRSRTRSKNTRLVRRKKKNNRKNKKQRRMINLKLLQEFKKKLRRKVSKKIKLRE